MRQVCRSVTLLLALASALAPLYAQTYAKSATPFNFIATAGHTAITTWAGGLGCPDTIGDDSISAPINIGFSFRFGTVSYTQLRVQTNGRLQFANTYCGFGTQAVGPPRTYTDPIASANLNNAIRIYGADLDLSAGGSITYATVGTAPNRRFVVTWSSVPQWSAAGTSYSLQVQLDESGDFYYMYGASTNVTSPGGVTLGPAQVAWQLSNTDFAVVQSGLPANNSGMVFKPPRPALTVAKTSEVLSDPVNGASNPKRIPGAVLRYSVNVVNGGRGTVDASTLAISDPVPAGTSLYVGTVSGAAVDFVDGPVASGLAFSLAANVSYSNQPGGGAPYSYTPVPDAAGFDSAVTGVRIAPTGVMNAAAGASTPSFTVRFRTRIR
jgi:uncharacterized repeat protein (TIGR01451 family)